MQTLTLGAPGSHDASAVGNKAANLAGSPRTSACRRVSASIPRRMRRWARPPRRTAPSAASSARRRRRLPHARGADRRGGAQGGGPLVGHRRGRDGVVLRRPARDDPECPGCRSGHGRRARVLALGGERASDWRTGKRAVSTRRRGSRSSCRKWWRRTSRRSPSASTRSRRIAPSSSSTPRRAWAIGSRQVKSRRIATSSVRRTSASSSARTGGALSDDDARAIGRLVDGSSRSTTRAPSTWSARSREASFPAAVPSRHDARQRLPDRVERSARCRASLAARRRALQRPAAAPPRGVHEQRTALRSRAASRVLRCAGGRPYGGLQRPSICRRPAAVPARGARSARARFDRSSSRVRSRPATHVG